MSHRVRAQPQSVEFERVGGLPHERLDAMRAELRKHPRASGDVLSVRCFIKGAMAILPTRMLASSLTTTVQSYSTDFDGLCKPLRQSKASVRAWGATTTAYTWYEWPVPSLGGTRSEPRSAIASPTLR